MITRCEKKVMADESFNQILAEVKALARDRDEQLQLLTERVVFDLIQSKSNKSQHSNISDGQIPKWKRSNLLDKAREVTKKRKVSSTETNSNNYVEEKAAAARNYLLEIRKQNSRSSRSRKRKYDDEPCKLINKKKMKMKTTKAAVLSIPCPPPVMPSEFKNKIESMHGYQVEFVIDKGLYHTDLSTHHDRLSIPAKKVFNEKFLGEFEEKLKDYGSLQVKVIDPRLKDYELGFTRWNSESSFAYVLNKGWNAISTDKTDVLKVNDQIHVWSFRVKSPKLDEQGRLINQEHLCFAIVKVKDTGGKDVNGSSSSGSHETVKSMTKNDEGKEDINGSSDSHDAVESIITKNYGGKQDINHSTVSHEVNESPIIEKDEEKEDINHSTASHEAISSTMTKNQLEFGGRKHAALSIV